MNAERLDKDLAEALAELPVGWQLSFLSFQANGPDDQSWQAILQNENQDMVQGLGGTPSAAFHAAMNAATHETEVSSGECKLHPTISVELPDGPADIDVEIAPLLVELVRIGLRTVTSCQADASGRSYVEFESTADVATFVEIATSEFSTELESVWNRAFAEDEPEVEWAAFRKRIWSYRAAAMDLSVVYRDPDAGDKTLVRAGPAEVEFRVVVAFPPSDLPYLIERFRSHLA